MINHHANEDKTRIFINEQIREMQAHNLNESHQTQSQSHQQQIEPPLISMDELEYMKKANFLNQNDLNNFKKQISQEM